MTQHGNSTNASHTRTPAAAAEARTASSTAPSNAAPADDRLDDLPALSVRRPYLAWVLNLLIVVAGIGAVFGVEVRELPNVDRPIVTVRANYPGGSPETIDAEITSTVEAAVARVAGISEVRSSSEEGNFRIRAVFRPGTDLIDAANDVREAVARVQRELPDGVEDIFVVKADADSQAIVQLAVSSPTLGIDALTRKVDREVVPALTTLDGVAEVRIFGERDRVLRVEVDPMRLAAFGLSVADVVSVLREARYDVPTGSFTSSEQDILVRADATVTDPVDVEQLILREPVRLGEVASVYFAPAEPESIVRRDGEVVLTLGIVRRAQSNTVAISQDVRDAVGELNDRYRDLTIQVNSDDAVFITGAINEVLSSLVIAVLIVVLVLAVFLGSVRAALIPAVTIPIALIGMVAAIWLLGYSINLITLLALVLATGIVVDDAIVVLENTERLKAMGVRAKAAAVIGTRQVFFAVVATTATLISVFLPISFLPSSAGRLFGEFGVVLAVTVCISSFVALTVVPALAAATPGPADEQARGRRGKRSVPAILMDRLLAALGVAVFWPIRQIGRLLTGLYAGPLHIVLTVPLLVLVACSSVFVLGYLQYQTLAEELVPEEDRGVIRVWMTGPDGTGLDFTDRQVERAEAILQPYVDAGVATGMLSITGRWDPNRGQIIAPLAPWEERTVGEGQIASEVNKALADIPGARARVSRGNSLGLRGGGSGIHFAVTGPDYFANAQAANALVARLEETVTAAESFRVEFRATQPQLSLQIDRRRAADLGVPLSSLADTVRALIDKDEVAEITRNDERIPIILTARTGSVTAPGDVANLFIPARDGRLVPLSQLISITETAVPGELDRHGQRRAVDVYADTADGASLREAVEAIRGVANDTLPPGMGILFLGEAGELGKTSYGVAITYALALLIVFLVLVAQFESLTSATVVILTVPFGLCAAVFALAATGTSINIYSQIGVLMLIGIMAKNAILMVEFADQLRERGHSVAEAAHEASRVRLRPITMTMLSTVLAGLPLILGEGPGSEARAAIGWVVFGGLGLAGLFTLYLTPALYVLIAPLSQPRSAAGEAVRDELARAENVLARD